MFRANPIEEQQDANLFYILPLVHPQSLSVDSKYISKVTHSNLNSFMHAYVHAYIGYKLQVTSNCVCHGVMQNECVSHPRFIADKAFDPSCLPLVCAN